MILDGKYGVVRPYGKREVSFVFAPSMPGPFHETLMLENLLNMADRKPLVMRADVRKAQLFFVSTLSLALPPCLVDDPQPRTASFVLTNTSRYTRVFEVSAGGGPREGGLWRFDVCDVLVGLAFADDASARAVTDAAAADRIEALEQKLKIARRKVAKPHAHASERTRATEGPTLGVSSRCRADLVRALGWARTIQTRSRCYWPSWMTCGPRCRRPRRRCPRRWPPRRWCPQQGQASGRGHRR
jgi:hypothetical protein